MSIAEITIKVHKRYLDVLTNSLLNANIPYKVFFDWDQIKRPPVDWAEVKMDYTSNLMDVLTKFFNGLEIQIAVDNTL